MPGECRKVRYRDRLAALLAMSRKPNRHTRRAKDERRVYYCRDCRSWHLTSQR